MSEYQRKVFCGIEFNLRERGDADYRDACLKEWLEKNCSSPYRYEWWSGSADDFMIYFDSKSDYEKSAVLLEKIPHKTGK